MVSAVAFLGIRERVKRAFELIAAIETETQSWARDNARELQYRRTADGLHEWYVDPPAQPPLSMSIDCGLTFYLLRSCFDYAAWQFIELSGGKPSRATAFPIVSDEARWTTARQNMLPGVDAQVLQVIREMQPFVRGGEMDAHALKFIDDFAQVERHRYLVGTAGLADELDFSPHASTTSRAMREFTLHAAEPGTVELDETLPTLVTVEVTYADGRRDPDIRWERTEHAHEVRPSIIFSTQPSRDRGVPAQSLRPLARDARAALLRLEVEAARLEKSRN